MQVPSGAYMERIKQIVHRSVYLHGSEAPSRQEETMHESLGKLQVVSNIVADVGCNAKQM